MKFRYFSHTKWENGGIHTYVHVEINDFLQKMEEEEKMKIAVKHMCSCGDGLVIGYEEEKIQEMMR